MVARQLQTLEPIGEKERQQLDVCCPGSAAGVDPWAWEGSEPVGNGRFAGVDVGFGGRALELEGD
ncbi:MAG: hypothetical protein ACKOZW_11820, partial [Cyanobium sp.]